MARLFGLRPRLDFGPYRVLCAPPGTSSPGHYAIESSMRHIAMEACKFGGNCQEFYGRLEKVRRGAVSRMLPVAQEASGLARQAPKRMRAARVAVGGGSSALDARGTSTEGGIVECASLANMAIGDTMHAMPGEFLCALGKAAHGSHVGGHGEPAGSFRDVPGRVGARPIHCMDMGHGRRGVPAGLSLQECARAFMLALAHRGTCMARKRAIAAPRLPKGRYSRNVVEPRAHGAVSRGFLWTCKKIRAVGVAEWAAVNVAHHRTRGPSIPPLPDLPWEGRRADHGAVERAVSLARARAGGALARACPVAA